MISKNKFNFVLLVLLICVLLLTGCSDDEVTKKEDPKLITFSDDFSDTNSGWTIETKENVTYGYVNGKYEIKSSKVSWDYWAYPPIEKLGSQYTIKADMTLTQGEKGRYGFVFNYVSQDDYYVFKVNPVTKYYTVERRDNDTWHEIVDWTQDTENINNIDNHLKLVQEGSKLELYVNNVKLTETDIVKHSEGIKVGLLVSTLDDTSYLPVVAQFDNFEISGYGIE